LYAATAGTSPAYGLRKTEVGLVSFVQFFSATFFAPVKLLCNSFITYKKLSDATQDPEIARESKLPSIHQERYVRLD
jgi:hypothetical protein